MSEREHWEAVHAQKPEGASWYRPHLERSLAFIEGAGLPKTAAIIDVGGGNSTLVDDLLDRGFTDLTVLDISSKAIAGAKERLGARQGAVNWIVADITQLGLPQHHFEFWHDRAVFHFLRDVDARRRYVASVQWALKPGGHIVVATFGPEGPERCSGLEVMRYSADDLHGQFGSPFEKVATRWGSAPRYQSSRPGAPVLSRSAAAT